MDVLDRIYKLRESRNWTEYRLAEESGLPQSTISSWYRKNLTPSICSLEKICDGFKITMSQFFANEGEAVYLTKEQHEMLEKWNTLSNEQKHTLLAFLSSIQPQSNITNNKKTS